MFRSRNDFFGLTPSDRQYLMDEVFTCHFHGRIGYTEVVHMPIWRRRWFIKRVQKELETMYKKKDN